MDTPEPEQELSAAELERAEPFQKLREEMHRISDKETEERIRTNPAPTEEEILAGAFREMIEPQVRNAVFGMRRKGYATQSSGFGGDYGELQAIDGYFTLDEDTAEKIRALGVTIEYRPPEEEYPNSAYTVLLFRPAAPDISQIENKWEQIVALMPDKGHLAPPSISGGAEDFQKSFAPDRTDIEKEVIERRFASSKHHPRTEEKMQARLNEINSNKT